MVTRTRVCILLVMMYSSSTIFSTKEALKSKPPKITPRESAVLACAAYEHHKHTAQEKIDELCGPTRFEIVLHKEHNAKEDGGHATGFMKPDNFNISVIVAKDRIDNTMHVAVQGRDHPCDTTKKDKENIHSIISKCLQKYGGQCNLATAQGKTMGGILLRKIIEKYPDYYRDTKLFTYNSKLFTDSGDYDHNGNILVNELPFACEQEKGNPGPIGRDIVKVESPVHARVGKDYDMKHFVYALEGKTYKDLLG